MTRNTKSMVSSVLGFSLAGILLFASQLLVVHAEDAFPILVMVCAASIFGAIFSIMIMDSL